MKNSLTQTLIDKIQRQILYGELKVGDKLPTLREMVDIYGFSRSVINAAVVELESSGFITIKNRHGMFVNDWKREGTLSVFSVMAKHDALDKEILISLFDSRKLIELESVKLAAQNASNEDVNFLTKINVEGKKCIDIKSKIDYDRKFHHTIALLSRNMIYPLIIKSFEAFTDKLMNQFYHDKENFEFVIKQHNLIIGAISAHETENAVFCMKILLEQGEKSILKAF